MPTLPISEYFKAGQQAALKGQAYSKGYELLSETSAQAGPIAAWDLIDAYRAGWKSAARLGWTERIFLEGGRQIREVTFTWSLTADPVDWFCKNVLHVNFPAEYKSWNSLRFQIADTLLTSPEMYNAGFQAAGESAEADAAYQKYCAAWEQRGREDYALGVPYWGCAARIGCQKQLTGQTLDTFYLATARRFWQEGWRQSSLVLWNWSPVLDSEFNYVGTKYVITQTAPEIDPAAFIVERVMYPSEAESAQIEVAYDQRTA